MDSICKLPKFEKHYTPINIKSIRNNFINNFENYIINLIYFYQPIGNNSYGIKRYFNERYWNIQIKNIVNLFTELTTELLKNKDNDNYMQRVGNEYSIFETTIDDTIPIIQKLFIDNLALLETIDGYDLPSFLLRKWIISKYIDKDEKASLIYSKYISGVMPILILFSQKQEQDKKSKTTFFNALSNVSNWVDYRYTFQKSITCSFNSMEGSNLSETFNIKTNVSLILRYNNGAIDLQDFLLSEKEENSINEKINYITSCEKSVRDLDLYADNLSIIQAASIEGSPLNKAVQESTFITRDSELTEFAHHDTSACGYGKLSNQSESGDEDDQGSEHEDNHESGDENNYESEHKNNQGSDDEDDHGSDKNNQNSKNGSESIIDRISEFIVTKTNEDDENGSTKSHPETNGNDTKSFLHEDDNTTNERHNSSDSSIESNQPPKRSKKTQKRNERRTILNNNKVFAAGAENNQITI